MIIMSKEEVLKNLFELNQEDILDIEEIIHGYRGTINKSGKDTILLRCLFAKGYHNTKEFYNKVNITKDSSLATTIFDKSDSLKSYLSLKKLLNIDDSTFWKILNEKLEENNE